MVNHILRIFILIIVCFNVSAEFPENLDDFLGILFETEQCESFVSSADYLSVSTTKCSPFTCDFPYQVCMRPSALYKEEKANECRDIPVSCLLAANGNKALPNRKSNPNSVDSNKNTVKPIITKPEPPPTGSVQNKPPPPTRKGGSVCKMDIPHGRFCGFKQMLFWNKENKACEQFWFAGCTTDETNANLFETNEECVQATKNCKNELIPKITPITQRPTIINSKTGTTARKNNKRTTNAFRITTEEPPHVVNPREYGGNSAVGGNAVKQGNLAGLFGSALTGKGHGKGGNPLAGLGGLNALGGLAKGLSGKSGGGGNLIQGLLGSMGNMGNAGGNRGSGGAGIAQQMLSGINWNQFLGR